MAMASMAKEEVEEEIQEEARASSGAGGRHNKFRQFPFVTLFGMSRYRGHA